MKAIKHKVILADDHIVLRDALASLISGFEGFSVLAVASNGLEVLDAIKRGARPDVIILDVSMPLMDGYETTRWLTENFPEIKILILTMYDSEITLIKLLQDGVRGFLKKDIHPNELKNAIECVTRDGYYYNAGTSNKMAAMFKKTDGNITRLERTTLSDLEMEFLRKVSSDQTYKEIAMSMKLSTRVIDTYRDGLFEKLNVKSRVGLAIFAIKNGIVSF